MKMKKILSVAILAAVFTTGANADINQETKDAITLNACTKAIKNIEETTATSSKFSFTDRTGRQMDINFGVLCSSLDKFDDYLNSGRFSDREVRTYTAAANYLLVRSIKDYRSVWWEAETEAGKFDYKKYPNVKRGAVVMVHMTSYLYTDYLDKFDNDLNMLTSNTYGEATNAGAIVRCYIDECSKGELLGTGNKAYQKFIFLLTKRDYQGAEKHLRKTYSSFFKEGASNAYAEELKLIAGFKKAKMRRDGLIK